MRYLISQRSRTDHQANWIGSLRTCCFSAWLGITVGGVGWLLPGMTGSSVAAERIYVSYSVLERSVSVKSLETYAKQGKILDEDLAVYAQYANLKDLEQLRSALTSKADVGPVAISQFLYSYQGEALLKRLGQVIQTESRQSDFRAIRAALIGASVDPEGLTPLNFLRKFPTRGIRVDVERSLEIVSSLEKLVNQTKRATAAVFGQSTLEMSGEEKTAKRLSEDLRSAGPFRWQKLKDPLYLTDSSRISTPVSPVIARMQPLPRSTESPAPQVSGRQIPVDVYLPNPGQAKLPKTLPVIVISHGLGSDRSTFAYIARHLASYGFAVLVPEHPGSNSRQIEALLSGVANELAEPAEFLDRPLDITFLLNAVEAEAKKQASLKGRLNLNQVGVIGQSFGAYTALAVGGAPVNIQELQSDCRNQENTLNLSLLLQCRALLLKQTETNLHDSRVKAVIALNPFISAVFGPASINQVKIPTMILSGNGDTVAPALLEQIQPFTEFAPRDKYLVLVDGELISPSWM